MIADGVHQGYLEVRVMMGTKKGQQPRLPSRPWRVKARDEAPTDWVSGIARLSQRPGAGSLAPQRVAEPVMDTDTFRRLIADGRAEAIAASRVH